MRKPSQRTLLALYSAGLKPNEARQKRWLQVGDSWNRTLSYWSRLAWPESIPLLDSHTLAHRLLQHGQFSAVDATGIYWVLSMLLRHNYLSVIRFSISHTTLLLTVDCARFQAETSTCRETPKLRGALPPTR